FLRILFCGVLLMATQEQACEEIDQFIEKIPYEQKITLEHTSKNMLTSMFATLGYVLYGNKPMCIVGAYELLKIPNAQASCDIDLTELKWFDFLTGLNIQPQDKKYPFIECRHKYLRHLIFINRNLFIETVNKNLPLFRSVLGRTLTAESFLDTLLKSGDHFYDTLKFNKLLLGILLGYGTQNALLVSREEDLTCELGDDRTYFPFENYETFIGFQQVPSIGFSTIQEEQEKLSSLIQISTNIKDFDDCPIPNFGCDLSLKETKDLLSIYEKNREKIIKIVREENVLAKLLKCLCTTVSGTVRPPHDLDKQIYNISYEDSSILKKFVDCIALDMLQKCKDPHFKQKPLIEAVLKGMKCAEERGFCPTPDWTGSWSRGYDARRVFEQHVNKKKANQLLQRLAKQNDVIELIPKHIYYKVLVKGKGIPATNHIKNATFHFSLYADDGTFIDSGTIKKVDLEKLVSGVAYSLIGMQKGEERVVYIHPKYAYERPLYPSMILTTTHLKLLDFEEGEAEASLSKVHTDLIDAEHFQQFLHGYQKAKKASCFYSGYHFWKNIKELGVDLELEEFSKRFKSEFTSPLFQSDNEERQFILNFNCYLFSREYASRKKSSNR
ncbi:MAG: FKBP-type peptidyl-prolyl cis-trans isomerase, partial [Chlamydiales bacterium]|nr:FKBP-type peptidyl-prolyl cis-trans isomerase [Chlamydiales bacterium]